MCYLVAAAFTPRSTEIGSRALASVLPGSELRRRAFSSTATRRNLNVQSATEARKLKSIDDLPGPSLATSLYWFFVKEYADKRHLLQVLIADFYFETFSILFLVIF